MVVREGGGLLQGGIEAGRRCALTQFVHSAVNWLRRPGDRQESSKTKRERERERERESKRERERAVKWLMLVVERERERPWAGRKAG